MSKSSELGSQCGCAFFNAYFLISYNIFAFIVIQKFITGISIDHILSLKIQKISMAEQEKQITIEDLQLSLEVYQLQSQQKLAKLQNMFKEKGSIDPAKMFYEDRSSLQVKFQNIIADLLEFLVKQQVASTQKLRKTFYRILESPLLLLFKVSRFQIFDLRLNGFDIQLEPIEAIQQLATSMYKNIEQYNKLTQQKKPKDSGNREYATYQQFLIEALISAIQDKIFILYSYLRKGSAVLKKKFQNKVKIVQIFNNIENQLLKKLLQNQDWKTIKELATLNYQIYLLENSFDVLYFYLLIPLKAKAVEIFKELQLLAEKAKQGSNYDIFIFAFVKNYKQIINKVQKEGIDPIYYSYIENTLKTLLQLWGCKLCLYKQFCMLFEALFNLYQPRQKILQICLKHSPKLQKQDIVLMRTHFKIDAKKNYEQLLSLLTGQTLEQINNFLSSFFHKSLYNLDFRTLDREQLINLLTLLNGNSSLDEFFGVVEKAMKEWNHTIDFAHNHKFIQSQFSYPKLAPRKVQESLNLLKNFCALQDKNFNKLYEPIIKSGTVTKALLGLVRFLNENIANEDVNKVTKEQMCQQLFVQSFHFLIRCSDQIQQICEIYSKVTRHVASDQKKKKIADSMIYIIGEKIDSFHITTLISLFQEITKSYNPDQKYTKQLISLMMLQTQQMNQLTQCFSLLGQKVSDFNQRELSQRQANFLKQSTIIKNGEIAAKHNGIFKLSEFEIVTNPIQFDRIMDNYYFNLQQNSKRFVQYLVENWTTLAFEPNQEFFMQCLIELIKQYTISIPLMCSTRVNNQKILKKQQSSRFVQLLCHSLGRIPKVEQLFQIILNCKGIRYKNGMDYIRQEINPMVLKQLIGIINTSNEPNIYVSAYEILTLCLKNFNLPQIKLDIIQKTIQMLNYSIGISKDANEIQRLSECHFNLLKTFFLKKQLDMRKNNLASHYVPLLWNDIRQHTAKKSEQLKAKQYQRVSISEQIIVSPFTIAKDFQLQNYKISKSSKKVAQDANRTMKAVQIINSLQKQQDLKFNMSLLPKLSDTVKKIDLKNLGWNLRLHLGEDNITSLQHKENIIIDQGFNNEYTGIKTDEQNKTLIQYYLKELEQPSIHDEIIIKTIQNLLQSEEKISTTWTNPINFQRIFIDLNVLLACSEKNIPDNKANSIIANIINLLRENPIKVAKRVLDIFSQIGYSDLWAQSYQTLPVKTKLSQSLKQYLNFEQGFLPILLRICLEKQQLKESFDNFLKHLFKSRPSEQNTLMYKVTIDKHLLNLIMKSLHIKHLNEVSLMIHSNFNNLRLYTDQLHEGLKALNIASKNRSYNEFIQLAKQFEDQQFLGPVKLFKQNFAFFIRIQKEGYLFKKNQQVRLTIQRISNCIRSQQQNKVSEINKIMEEHTGEIKKLQLNIANRVKSFYLVTKLRDLSYQNAFTMTLLHQILAQTGKTSEQILQAIDKIEIFTLVNEMFNSLVLFEKNWTNMSRYHLYPQIDKKSIQSDITICSTRRFSHSMSKVYEQCDLQYDEILQRCFQVLKMFLSSKQGQQYLKKNKIYPPFLVRNFIPDNNQSKQFLQAIQHELNKHKLIQQYSFQAKSDHLIADLIKGLRNAPKGCFYSKQCNINVDGSKKKLEQLMPIVVEHLKKTETLVQTKDNVYLVFNKYKTSQATLQEIQIMSYLLAYCIYQNIKIDLPLHPSLISVFSFNIAQLDDLLNIDFQVWEDLRNILSTADSKTLNLNFSYTIESLTTFQKQRVQLIDKGASKKVNNLNRQQFTDLICCRILYKNYERQITRMLQSILMILPKQYISTLPISYLIKHLYNNNLADQFIKSLMKKIGLETPDVVFFKGTKIDNLKDYQNINWLQELLLQKKQLREKYWPDETNLFVATTIGSSASLRTQGNLIIINHFTTKEEMQKALCNS